MFEASFFTELTKLAEKKQKWTKKKVLELAHQLGIPVDPAMLKDLNEEQLAQMAKILKERARSIKKLKETKSEKSDIARAADRKKMLLGVKREKAILHVDYMKRVNKKNRLSTRPFMGLKKQQREMRLGLTRGVRRQARAGYGRK